MHARPKELRALQSVQDENDNILHLPPVTKKFVAKFESTLNSGSAEIEHGQSEPKGEEVKIEESDASLELDSIMKEDEENDEEA